MSDEARSDRGETSQAFGACEVLKYACKHARPHCGRQFPFQTLHLLLLPSYLNSHYQDG
jgi:hypothetical protein